MNVKLYAMTCDRIDELWRWGWRVSPDGYRAIAEYAKLAWEACQALERRVGYQQPIEALAGNSPTARAQQKILAWGTLAELLIIVVGMVLLFLLDFPAQKIAAGREFRRWADAAVYGGQWWGEKFWAVYRAPERLLCAQVAY